jgi:hypothetical protein
MSGRRKIIRVKYGGILLCSKEGVCRKAIIKPQDYDVKSGGAGWGDPGVTISPLLVSQ